MRKSDVKTRDRMNEREKRISGRECIMRECEERRVKERERQDDFIVEHISITFLKFGPRLNQRLCVQMVKCVLGCGPASGWGLADA